MPASATWRAASCCRASASRALLDPGSPFLELGQLAAFGMYGDEVPAAGIITGIGRVAGRECMIVGNDATVKGGTYYPMTVKKHLRAQEIARAEPPALHLPGRFRRRQPAEPGRGVSRPRPLRPHLLQPGQPCRPPGIPQIAVVMGSCTAGGAYVPAMADESVIVREPGHDLPRRPAAGEGGDRRGRERRGARRRRRAQRASPASPTTTPHDDAHALAHRAPHRRQPQPREARRARRCSRAEEPLYDPTEIYGIVPPDLRSPTTCAR